MNKIRFEVIQNDDNMEFKTYSEDPQCTLLGRFQSILKIIPLGSLKLTNHIIIKDLRITESQMIEIIEEQFNPEVIQLEYIDNSTVPKEPTFNNIMDILK